MKRLEIYFDSYFIDMIRSEMRQYGAEKYFIIPEVHSRWTKTLKHFNNHRWPGTDSILITYLEDEEARELMRVVKKIKADLGDTISMGVVTLPVDDIVL